MKRRFEVELRGTVTIEVDDEARSDWKPEQGILDTYADPERFVEGSTVETVLGALAITVGVDGRRVGGTDGWADFPADCVTQIGWPDWSVEWSQESPR